MDVKTRGLISGTLNYAFEEQNVLDTMDWILEADDHTRSQEDLALGYFLGALMNISCNLASRVKQEETLGKLWKKELEKIHGKKEAAKRLQEQNIMLEQERAKGGRRIKTELTEEETDDIRNMLIPMIQSYREKIRKELAMRAI